MLKILNIIRKKKKYKTREIEEGLKDIGLSPFDGCGCHEENFMNTVSEQLGLDYKVIGTQVRLPFIKGYSVYVPFKQILKEWGYTTITDIYGHIHNIDDVFYCILEKEKLLVIKK